jgi:protein required for attachment to host cells
LRRNEHRLVVVADGGRARFFSVEPAAGELVLIEQEELANLIQCRGEDPEGRIRSGASSDWQGGPVHPTSARRAQQEIGLDRRFAQQIESRVSERASDWTTGLILLVAEPRLLGLLRDALRSSLKPDVELKELAKDYAHLTPAELRHQLVASGIIPGREIPRER